MFIPAGKEDLIYIYLIIECMRRFCLWERAGMLWMVGGRLNWMFGKHTAA
jgi:hypothetical protein